MSITNNDSNRGNPSIYRPEANAWISKRSSDLDYKGVFALIKIGVKSSQQTVVRTVTHREHERKDFWIASLELYLFTNQNNQYSDIFFTF